MNIRANVLEGFQPYNGPERTPFQS